MSVPPVRLRVSVSIPTVSPGIADKIAERNPNMVVQAPETSTALEEDDPYAEYQIPDDLMW